MTIGQSQSSRILKARTIPSPQSAEGLQVRTGDWEDEPHWLLYHYTSQSTLLEMLKSGGFWATHLRYMNDSREYLHAFDVLKGALEVVWGEATIEEHVSFLEGVPEDAQRFEESNVYAVCFSEVPDLLSQWRAYCPNGSGVALGFTTGDLRDITEFQAFQLGRCIYDSKEQTEKVLYELRFYLRRLLEEENPTPAFTQRMVREFILHSFLAIAPFFKDPAFSEEREWRLVLEFVPQLKDLGFRIGGSTLTPYVKTGVAYPGETLALAQIIIGPTPHPELVVSAMDLLKAKYNLARTTLHKSTIPYRPW